MTINGATDLRIGADGASAAYMNGVKVWPSGGTVTGTFYAEVVGGQVVPANPHAYDIPITSATYIEVEFDPDTVTGATDVIYLLPGNAEVNGFHYDSGGHHPILTNANAQLVFDGDIPNSWNAWPGVTGPVPYAGCSIAPQGWALDQDGVTWTYTSPDPEDLLGDGGDPVILSVTLNGDPGYTVLSGWISFDYSYET